MTAFYILSIYLILSLSYNAYLKHRLRTCPKVWIIDDDPALLAVAVRTLSGKYDLHCFISPADLPTYFFFDKPDFVFVDQNLQGSPVDGNTIAWNMKMREGIRTFLISGSDIKSPKVPFISKDVAFVGGIDAAIQQAA